MKEYPQVWYSITLRYNPFSRELDVHKEEGISTYEAFGVLEAAKQMIAHDWMQEGEPE